MKIRAVRVALISSISFLSVMKPIASFAAPKGDASRTPKQVQGQGMNNLRVELFFRNTDDLRDRVQFLSSNGVKAFNLVNKSNKDNLKHCADVIRKEVPDSDICLHYSLKYNKCRKKDGAFHLFSDFVNHMKGGVGDGNGDEDGDEKSGNGNGNRNEKGQVTGKNEILLITGSGPKGKLDSVTALERLSQLDDTKSIHTTKNNDNQNECTISVAFNPFFPSQEDYEIEKERLVKKIETQKVGKIYIQFGTDLERLRSSLDWLTELCKDKNDDNANDNDTYGLSICASIFLPTKKLIAQQKFRPWNGVFLSEEFLSSEDSARGIVLHMMDLYQKYSCEILIEAPGVRNVKDFKILQDLVADRDSIKEEAMERSNVVGDEKQTLLQIKSESTNTSAPAAGSPKRRRIGNILSKSSLVCPEALEKTAIVLFGTHDVRLHDNVAFQQASFHSTIIPVFIWSLKDQERWGVSGASEVVLKDAIRNLHLRLEKFGMRLICRSADDPVDEICKLCEECGVGAVYLNKEHTTESRAREEKQQDALAKNGIPVFMNQSSLLYDPECLSLQSGFNGGHWGTLMPFLKGCKKQLGDPRRPIPRYQTLALLEAIKGPSLWPASVSLEDLKLADVNGEQKWDVLIKERFPMSEEDAYSTLNIFFQEGFHRYEKERSRADIDWSTSKLSAHLRIGTLSPNELYYRIEDSELHYEDKKTFSRRLFWRDLAYFHLLSFPQMRDKSIRTHYDETEWVTGTEEEKRFKAWKTGNTGYPLVDAGMRELYATGWMTQSIRMVVASFLTEYLRVNWVKGCEWFHYTLVDADSAINPMMWQNAGRSGIDQWNFVMSPVAASQDATGDYTKRWIPELSRLSKPILHKPWEASDKVLKECGVVLGETYPHRIVTNLKEEKEISDQNVLNMRRNNQLLNSNRGYDLIAVDGKQTVVFTKKQFRIDREGNVLKGKPHEKAKDKQTGDKKRKPRGRAGRTVR